MRFSTSVALASLASAALAAPASPTATDTADVYAAQATALTETVTSKVKGKVFDRYVSIWLENTDYSSAAADRECNSIVYPSDIQC
jgi:acid phosphatase